MFCLEILFFKKYIITVDPKQTNLQLPVLTVELNQVSTEHGKKPYHTKKASMVLTKKVVIPPESQALLECHMAKCSEQYKSCTRLIIPGD